jgi:hypothetical protein
VKSKFAFVGRRYISLTIAIGFFFIYLLSTEIYDRYSSTLSLYQSLREKESTVLDPVLLEHKRKTLTAERDSLSTQISKQRSTYPQNEIGVIQCVSENARQTQVVVKSFNPGNQKASEQFEEFNFTLSTKGRFNQVGMLINRLENETIPFDITRVQIISNPIGAGILQLNIEAKAYLFHGIH